MSRQFRLMSILRLCASVCWLTLSAAETQTAEPGKGIDFEANEIARGDLPRNLEIKTVFRVRNASDSPVLAVPLPELGVKGVEPRGECWIQAGESLPITIRCNTERIRSSQARRLSVDVRKPVAFYRDAKLTYRVRSDIVCSAPKFDFGTVPKGDSTSKTVQIRYAGKPDWRITSARCTGNAVEVDVREVRREATTEGPFRIDYDIKVTLKDGTPVGQIDEVVEVRVDDRATNPFEILVEGNVIESRG